MAWIVKTPNRKYKVVERFPRGCRVRTVPTLELARQLQRRMEEQRKAQELGLSTSENLPLVEALEKYVAYRQTDLPPNSIRPEASRLKRLSAFWEEHGCAFVYDITPELLQRFKVRRLGEGAAKNTVNQEITLAKAFPNWLVRMRIVEHNPIAHVEKVRIPEHQRAIPSPDQARKVLATLEQKERYDGKRYPLRDYVYLALYAGLRREEVVQLKWDNVDFDERRLVICGKGGRLRVVPVCRQLLDFLKSRPRNGSLVVDPPWYKDTVSPYFRRTCEQIGIANVTFHGLRHTFASLLTGAFVPDVAVQRLLGHTSTRTTRIYQHVDAMLRQAIEPIEKLLP